jgi:hypothetical protein
MWDGNAQFLKQIASSSISQQIISIMFILLLILVLRVPGMNDRLP